MTTDISWLAIPVHRNFFKGIGYKWEEDQVIVDSLRMSFEGSIVAVETDRIKHFLEDKEIERVRMGFSPAPKKFKIENADDFYKFLAYNVEIAEE